MIVLKILDQPKSICNVPGPICDRAAVHGKRQWTCKDCYGCRDPIWTRRLALPTGVSSAYIRRPFVGGPLPLRGGSLGAPVL